MPESSTLSLALSNFVTNTKSTAIPNTVKTWGKLLLLDAIGNAFASTRYDFSHRALLALQGLDTGASTVIGMPANLTLRDAVLMNGTLIHGLDYDDTYLPGAAHLTASCIPTALGLASQIDCNGSTFLDAFILGLESGIRLAAAASGGFLKTGFHPTSLCGAFGSTLVAAKLMNLSTSQTVMAQGLVLSSASGNMQPTQEGAWSKRLHPGLMGSAAITASALARQGFTGPLQVYEGKHGLFNCYMGSFAGQADLSQITHELGKSWECLRTSIKLFPACYQSHAAMLAALEIRDQEHIDPEAIESVRVRVAQAAVALVCEPEENKKKPHNSYAAQFSMHYALACCLIRGKFSLDEIEETAFGDPKLLELAKKTSYEVDPDSGFPKYRSGEVIVKMKNGVTYTRRKNVLPDEQAQPQSIMNKFYDNTQYAMSRHKAEALVETVLGIEKISSLRLFTQSLC